MRTAAAESGSFVGRHLRLWFVLQRQGVKQQPVSGCRPFVKQRALYFHPLKRHAGHPIRLGQRVLEVGGPRSRQPRGVGPNRFAGHQPDVEGVHGWIRPHVEAAQLAVDRGRLIGVDGNGLCAAFLETSFGKSVAIQIVKPENVSRYRGEWGSESIELDLRRFKGAG